MTKRTPESLAKAAATRAANKARRALKEKRKPILAKLEQITEERGATAAEAAVARALIEKLRHVGPYIPLPKTVEELLAMRKGKKK